jgi:hypothetical protein
MRVLLCHDIPMDPTVASKGSLKVKRSGTGQRAYEADCGMHTLIITAAYYRISHNYY